MSPYLPVSVFVGNSGPEGAVLDRFLLLGRAAAKALQDGRLLDVPLSYVFYKCVSLVPFCQNDVRIDRGTKSCPDAEQRR